MIFSESYVRVFDNSGVRVGKCVRVYGRPNGSVGDSILISVKKYIPNKKIEKGALFKAVLIKVRHSIYRKTGYYLQCKVNGVVLIKKDENLPIAKRIKSPVFFELRRRGFSRLLAMSPGIL